MIKWSHHNSTSNLELLASRKPWKQGWNCLGLEVKHAHPCRLDQPHAHNISSFCHQLRSHKQLAFFRLLFWLTFIYYYFQHDSTHHGKSFRVIRPFSKLRIDHGLPQPCPRGISSLFPWDEVGFTFSKKYDTVAANTVFTAIRIDKEKASCPRFGVVGGLPKNKA